MSVWIPVSVGIGGAIGSICRYAVGRFVANWTVIGFPWGTFLVNVVGSLLIGIWAGWLMKIQLQTPGRESLAIWDHALRVGFLGGFTTFSALSLETIGLLQANRFGSALVSVAGTY